MGTEPVLVTLGPARFGVGQVRAGQAGNEFKPNTVERNGFAVGDGGIA